MTHHPITLTVPSAVYERARLIAKRTSQPVERVLVGYLESLALEPLPPDEQAELDALAYLSDDALWTIAREQMPASLQAQMQVLMERNSRGQLSDNERGELDELVERGQHLTLRKAEAAALLTRRGQQVTPQNLAARNE